MSTPLTFTISTKQALFKTICQKSLFCFALPEQIDKAAGIPYSFDNT
jgi:hypothetical protein